MFGALGYLIWVVLAFRLFIYARWLWQKGYRLGTIGVVFIASAALASLLAGTYWGSGLE